MRLIYKKAVCLMTAFILALNIVACGGDVAVNPTTTPDTPSPTITTAPNTPTKKPSEQATTTPALPTQDTSKPTVTSAPTPTDTPTPTQGEEYIEDGRSTYWSGDYGIAMTPFLTEGRYSSFYDFSGFEYLVLDGIAQDVFERYIVKVENIGYSSPDGIMDVGYGFFTYNATDASGREVYIEYDEGNQQMRIGAKNEYTLYHE